MNVNTLPFKFIFNIIDYFLSKTTYIYAQIITCDSTTTTKTV